MHPDPKTLDALNAPKQHQTHPKVMYHPDGNWCEVASEAEESALDESWQETPTAAAELKAAREKIATAKTDAGAQKDDGQGKGGTGGKK